MFSQGPKTPKTSLFSFLKIILDWFFLKSLFCGEIRKLSEFGEKMQIGYIRVSTQDQDLSLQYDALHQAQCDKIYEDKASGAHVSRDGLFNKIQLNTPLLSPVKQCNKRKRRAIRLFVDRQDRA